MYKIALQNNAIWFHEKFHFSAVSKFGELVLKKRIDSRESMSAGKILHVNFSGRFGGAAIAAARLHRALRSYGVASEILCLRDPSEDPDISAFTQGFRKKLNGVKNRIVQKAAKLLGGADARSYNIFPSGLVRMLNQSDANIIHLHWVCGEMISIAELAKIKKPVVWTFHDMWPFCGAEHVTTGNRYVTGYQRSEFRVQSSELGFRESERGLPDASSLRPQAFFDLDRWTFLRKQKHWKKWHPQIVTPSNWLAECARQSVLFKGLDVQVIPNCLDLTVFKPMDQVECRLKMGLPLDKKLILCGAMAFGVRHKGMDLLTEALLRFSSLDKFEMVCVGGKLNSKGNIPVHAMGTIGDQETLACLYNAVDMFVLPSRIDNLPNMVAEAMSCGVPIVAFDICGLPDMVQHKVTGYLAKPFDTGDLAFGISWVLEMSFGQADAVAKAARRYAEELFSEKKNVELCFDAYLRACNG